MTATPTCRPASCAAETSRIALGFSTAQPFSAASYPPNRPVTGEEEGAAAPAETPLRDAEVSEAELNRDYQDRPRNKLDVPAFLRKQ